MSDIQIILSGTTQILSSQLSQPLNLDRRYAYAVCLHSAGIWNTNYNISARLANNKFAYKTTPTGTLKTLTLEDGSYEVSDINARIKELITDNGDTAGNVAIGDNGAILRCFITVKEGYCVDMSITGNLSSLLGFSPSASIVSTTGTTEQYYGTLEPNINNDITSYHIHCSLASNSSYVNGTSSDVLYTFLMATDSGSLMEVNPQNLVFAPLNTENITSASIWITDQNNNLISVSEHSANTFTILIRKMSRKD
jgi:hypothetical protein